MTDTKRLSDEEAVAIAGRLEGLVPGPWTRSEGETCEEFNSPNWLYFAGVVVRMAGHDTDDPQGRATSDFFFHARADILALLSDRAALTAELAAANARVAELETALGTIAQAADNEDAADPLDFIFETANAALEAKYAEQDQDTIAHWMTRARDAEARIAALEAEVKEAREKAFEEAAAKVETMRGVGACLIIADDIRKLAKRGA